jgi:hypothetical protein
MEFCCLGRVFFAKEFTVLLVHVLHVSHPSALKGSTTYSRELVDRFFKKHIHIDVSQTEQPTHSLRNLIASSRLEIAFEGRPKGYRTPNYNVYRTRILQDLLCYLKSKYDWLNGIFLRIVSMTR